MTEKGNDIPETIGISNLNWATAISAFLPAKKRLSKNLSYRPVNLLKLGSPASLVPLHRPGDYSPASLLYVGNGKNISDSDAITVKASLNHLRTAIRILRCCSSGRHDLSAQDEARALDWFENDGPGDSLMFTPGVRKAARQLKGRLLDAR